jgi:uncharacterized repeat protein (TIGR03943 family)
MERFLKSAALIGMGIFLYSRLVNGSVYFYINQRFVILTLLAATGFILVGASYYRRPGHRHEDHPEGSPEGPLTGGEGHHGHEHSEHNHSHLTWFGLLIVLIPLVLGWLVPPKPLGASAFSNREINVGSLQSVSPPGSNERMGLVSGEKNILDWLIDVHNSASPNELAGQEVHVIGVVYRDDRFEETQFLVGRFIVSCCVADASPIGLVVQSPEAAELADDQWVEITGHFETGVFDGEQMPLLIIETIQKIEPPPQPYLYG